jgi:hypothetical protein
MNTITATVFTDVTLQCASKVLSSQTANIQCRPPYEDNGEIQAYENSEACKRCFNNVNSYQINYYKNQEALIKDNSSSRINLPIDQDYTNVWQKLVDCGKNSCKACVYENVSEATVAKAITGCKSMSKISNQITQKINDAVTQKLSDNKDFIAPLAQMIGGSTMQQIVSNVSNRMASKITESVVANVQNTIVNNQNIKLDGSTVDGASQVSSFSSVLRYVQKTELMNSVFSDAEFTILQDLANKQNTIDELGNSVSKSVNAFSKMITSVVGKVVIFMILLLIVITVGVGVFLFSKFIKSAIDNENKRKQHQKVQSEKLSRFENF